MEAKMNRIERRLLVAVLFIGTACLAFARDKEDWVQRMHETQKANLTNPGCRVLYRIGIVRSTPRGTVVFHGVSEKMWNWYSTEGVKKFPSACFAPWDKAQVEIIFNTEGVAQTQGADSVTETHTANSDTSGTVSGDVNGTFTADTTTTYQTTSTVPYTRTYQPYSVYVYRLSDNSLVGSSSVVLTRQGGGAPGEALGYNLGAAVGEHHRVHKMFEDTLRAVVSTIE
jgi:hypothetical protein